MSQIPCLCLHQTVGESFFVFYAAPHYSRGDKVATRGSWRGKVRSEEAIGQGGADDETVAVYAVATSRPPNKDEGEE